MRHILQVCFAIGALTCTTAAMAQYYGGNNAYGSSSQRGSGYSTPSVPRTPMPNYGTGSNWNNTTVQGYTRKDGAYVAPHQRSMPDSSINNNWSTKGNVNPYTGGAGRQRGSGYR
jgi:hypothetical protein